jgi:hypothetical protein
VGTTSAGSRTAARRHCRAKGAMKPNSANIPRG